MGACAVLFKEAGFDVEGADVSFAPPMSDYLDSMNIACHDIQKVDQDFLKKYDLIVVGNSVGRNSELAQILESAGVAFTSFPTLLGEVLLKDRNVLAAIGTHGKTTTSYFLTKMLKNLGADPGYFIGGVIEGEVSAKLGSSPYFVIEGDEYDSAYFQKYSKFHQYQVDHVICTSLEYDHADIFEDFDAMKLEFKKLFDGFHGSVSYDPSYPAIEEVLDKNSNQISAYNPVILNESKEGTEFKLQVLTNEFVFKTNITGKHNIQNISGCILLLAQNGFEIQDIQNSIKNLAMVKRRQEERGHYKESLIIDDFAHHPKAIQETINALKLKYPDKKLSIIFEPVSATARSNAFQKEFSTCFDGADYVVIADTGIQTSAKSFEQLDTDKLVADIQDQDIQAKRVDSLESLLKLIDQISHKDNVIAIFSNRTCLGLWSSDFVKQLV